VVPRDELSRLSRFDDQSRDTPAPTVVDAAGEPVIFDGRSQLYLYPPPRPGQPLGGRFERIEIDPARGVFWGRLQTGPELMVPLSSVQYGKIVNFNARRTAGLVIGLVLTAGVAATAIAVPLSLR
jgi:hypothetical protein